MPSTQEWAAPRLAAKSGEVARPGYSDTSASEYLDKKDVLKAKVKAVAALIRSSSRVVVHRAGISTASGIGDYASKATNSVAPHLAKGKVRGGGGSRLVARPTLAHHALAAPNKGPHPALATAKPRPPRAKGGLPAGEDQRDPRRGVTTTIRSC